MRIPSLLADPGDRVGEFGGAGRGLAQPEGKARGCSLRVGHPHNARLHLQDLPGRVPELKDVADVGLDGEVFMHRADEGPLGL